ncbi:MAG: hypothetical protein J6K15_02450 [Lachnospiraceae bacterium]|nr:hypothetical protein [Lachnospiraceae bacterium]
MNKEAVREYVLNSNYKILTQDAALAENVLREELGMSFNTKGEYDYISAKEAVKDVFAGDELNEWILRKLVIEYRRGFKKEEVLMVVLNTPLEDTEDLSNATMNFDDGGLVVTEHKIYAKNMPGNEDWNVRIENLSTINLEGTEVIFVEPGWSTYYYRINFPSQNVAENWYNFFMDLLEAARKEEEEEEKEE